MRIQPGVDRPPWTLLSNHGHVLVAIDRNPDIRQADIAYLVGITPGAVTRILHDLEEANYVERERIGRRNHYRVLRDAPLRHPLEQSHTIADLLNSLR